MYLVVFKALALYEILTHQAFDVVGNHTFHLIEILYDWTEQECSQLIVFKESSSEMYKPIHLEDVFISQGRVLGIHLYTVSTVKVASLHVVIL